MIIKVISFFILLLIAIGIGWAIHQDSGYVLITFHHWEIETNVWMALMFALIFFVILWVLLRLIRWGSLLPRQWRLWREASQQRSAHRSDELGGCELIEEKWPAAEQYFDKAARAVKLPFLEYCAAAIAAQAQGANARREEYLRQAYRAAPQAEITLGILQAKLQIQGQQWPEAAITLKKLQDAVPQHPVVKELAAKIPENAS
jgi:HemY protein